MLRSLAVANRICRWVAVSEIALEHFNGIAVPRRVHGVFGVCAHRDNQSPSSSYDLRCAETGVRLHAEG